MVIAISSGPLSYFIDGISRVVALRADTCEPLWDVPAAVWSELAVADLDADGFAEIVFASSPPYRRKDMDDDETIIVLDHRGQVRATFQHRRAALRWQAAPLIADLDGVAPPEIVYRRTALRLRGRTLDLVWRAEPRSPDDRWISVPLAADLDGDGLPEILDGSQVLDGASGRDETPPNLLPEKVYPAAAEYAIPHVADFNQDGAPEALYVSAQGVSIYDFRARQILWNTRLPSEGGGLGPVGGPALIADLDGDGVTDFAFETRAQLLAYALKCVPDHRPPECQGAPGVLWSRIIQDSSSGIVGVTGFDFNADGVVEIVHRDQWWLRILSGPTGRTLFRHPVSSGTALEQVVIADATGDGRADLLVMSDDPGDYPPPPYEPETHQQGQRTKGLFVFTHESFASARPLWNQHAYQVSNINDDFTVPERAAPPWLGRLGMRLQAMPSPVNKVGMVSDLTGRIRAPLCGPEIVCKGRSATAGRWRRRLAPGRPSTAGHPTVPAR